MVSFGEACELAIKEGKVYRRHGVFIRYNKCNDQINFTDFDGNTQNISQFIDRNDIESEWYEVIEKDEFVFKDGYLTIKVKKHQIIIFDDDNEVEIALGTTIPVLIQAVDKWKELNNGGKNEN